MNIHGHLKIFEIVELIQGVKELRAFIGPATPFLD